MQRVIGLGAVDVDGYAQGGIGVGDSLSGARNFLATQYKLLLELLDQRRRALCIELLEHARGGGRNNPHDHGHGGDDGRGEDHEEARTKRHGRLISSQTSARRQSPHGSGFQLRTRELRPTICGT